MRIAAARSSSSAPSAAPTAWSSGWSARSCRAVAMHGNKSQSQRQKALASFESGHVDTLVATDVAARGIDVPDITHVINFDAPEDRDAYVHRVGRTGRAGRTGRGISFVMPEQKRDMRKIARDLGLADQFDAADGTPVAVPSDGVSSNRTRPHRGGGGGGGHNGNRSKNRSRNRGGGAGSGGQGGGGGKPKAKAQGWSSGRPRARSASSAGPAEHRSNACGSLDRALAR